MRRLTDNQRLTKKFLVGCTLSQYDVIMAESVRRGVAPTIIARECLRRGLESLEPLPSQPAPTPAVERDVQPRKRQRQKRQTTAPAIRQRQAEHDALCLPHLEKAEGGNDAVQRLEDAGIPSPSGNMKWDKVAIWRICKRNGISYQTRKREGK